MTIYRVHTNKRDKPLFVLVTDAAAGRLGDVIAEVIRVEDGERVTHCEHWRVVNGEVALILDDFEEWRAAAKSKDPDVCGQGADKVRTKGGASAATRQDNTRQDKTKS